MIKRRSIPIPGRSRKVTSTKTTVETKTAKENYTLPFEFKGNDNATVKKYKEHLGDGDIGSGKGKTKHASVTANLILLNQTTVRLNLEYHVWENDYDATQTKKSNSDHLVMNCSKDYDISKFSKAGEGKEESEKLTITTKNSVSLSNCPEVFIRDQFKGEQKKYMNMNPNNFSNNHVQSWLPTDSLQIIIDGNGNELTGKGLLRVKGTVEFTITRTQTITTVEEIENVSSKTAIGKTEGSAKVQDLIPDCVSDVLGHGYDITGEYAAAVSCKSVVLNLNELNKYKRVSMTGLNATDYRSSDGTTIEEYTSSTTKDLEVKVAGSGWGFAFSSDTKTSFSKDSYTKSGYNFIMKRCINRDKSYEVQDFDDPQKLLGFLEPKFIQDLDEKTADQLIKAYGTHVVLGMMTGTRFDYSMDYRTNISHKSEATSLTSTNSLSWSEGKASDKKSNGEDNSKVESSLDNFKGKENVSLKDICELLMLLTTNELLSQNGNSNTENKGQGENKTQKTNNSQKQDGSKKSIEVGVTYSESSSSDSYIESQSTNYHLNCMGGNSNLAQKIALNNDLSTLEQWIDTTGENHVFVDFTNQHLIAIYDLIPAGHKLTAAAVRDASEKYQREHSFTKVIEETGTEELEFNSYGKANAEKLNDSDTEMNSKAGKDICWQIDAELVNVGKNAGCAISLSVYEYDINRGKTTLQSHIVKYLQLGNRHSMAVDTSGIKSPTYQQNGKVTGKHHEWIDITEEVQDCEFFETNRHRIYIKVDGPGEDDRNNIGIKGTFLIPYITYKE